MDGSRPSEIIKKIDFRRPLESTQRDYISKGWKDVRIIHDFLLDITGWKSFYEQRIFEFTVNRHVIYHDRQHVGTLFYHDTYGPDL